MTKRWNLQKMDGPVGYLIVIVTLIMWIGQIPGVEARRLSVSEMQNIGGGETGCCKKAKSCDTYENCQEPSNCSDLFTITDKDDQCNDVPSGSTTCDDGTNPWCIFYYDSGNCVVDTSNGDCDNDTTEKLCKNGHFVDATCTWSTTVTWYSDGSTPCP